VRCFGIAYLSGCGKHKLSLASNPAAAVSSIIVVNYSPYTAFMESRDSFVQIVIPVANSSSNIFVVRIYT